MARKTSRRGGAWYDPRSWFKPGCESARKKSASAAEAAAAAKTVEDEVCAGEASATSLPTETPMTAEPAAYGGRSRTRRRRQTRRKYKGGKHRKSH